MKNKNWLNHLALSIRCLLLVGLCGTATAALLPQSDDDGGGPGNQDCDTTSAEQETDAVTGSGYSVYSDSDWDKFRAEMKARHEAREKMADDAGIVCKYCEYEARCFRRTLLRSGSMRLVFAEIMPVPEEHDGGWYCEATWTGKFKVKCDRC